MSVQSGLVLDGWYYPFMSGIVFDTYECDFTLHINFIYMGIVRCPRYGKCPFRVMGIGNDTFMFVKCDFFYIFV